MNLANILALWIFTYPAYSQVSSAAHGSIVVTYFSQEKIVMAADSRGNWGNGRKTDDQCKIAALGKDAIFSITGYLGSSSRSPGGGWSSAESAHKAYNLAKSQARPGQTAQKAATIWASLVKARVIDMLRLAPSELRYVVDAGSGIANGVFRST